jgi:DNA-binding MarR family transcriptional regulator
MSFELKQSQALGLLHSTALEIVREATPEGMADLSMRQLSILMIIYLETPPHTVRGLAYRLDVTKPVITRALDTMGKAGLVSRRRDLQDGRNVVIQRTVAGALFVEKLGDLVAAKALDLPR